MPAYTTSYLAAKLAARGDLDLIPRLVAEDLLAVRRVVADMWRQRADDRCVLDQDALYAACGLPPPDRRVGDQLAMIENCVRFVRTACAGGGPWKTYAELEAENAGLRKENARLRAEVDDLGARLGDRGL